MSDLRGSRIDNSYNYYTVAEECAPFVGLWIEGFDIDGEEFIINFPDGRTLTISDRGQSCCEHRYMHTDDDLAAFAGAKFVSIEHRGVAYDLPGEEYDVLDCAFVLVNTSLGTITLASYNHHNGYYGGWHLVVEANC